MKKKNQTTLGNWKSSFFILFCFLINILKLFMSPSGKPGCFPHPRSPNTAFFLRCPGKQPLYPPAKFSVEMSLLFSKVILCCERSKEKKWSWTRLALIGSQSPNFTIKTHNDAFTEEAATAAVFKTVINRVSWILYLQQRHLLKERKVAKILWALFFFLFYLFIYFNVFIGV